MIYDMTVSFAKLNWYGQQAQVFCWNYAIAPCIDCCAVQPITLSASSSLGYHFFDWSRSQLRFILDIYDYRFPTPELIRMLSHLLAQGSAIERGGTGIYSQLTSTFRFLMALTNRCMLSFAEKSNKQDFIDIPTELFIGCNAAVLSRIVAAGTMPQHSCSPQVVFLRAANDALLREARNVVNRFSNDPDLVSSAGAPIKRLWPRSTRLFLNTRRRKTSLVTGVWGNRESGAVGWPLFHGQLLWGRNLCSGPEGRTWSWYVAARIWWNLFGAFLYFDVVAF